MGQTTSKNVEKNLESDLVSQSTLTNLKKFASNESIDFNDPLWNALSSMAIPTIFTQNDFVQVQNLADDLLNYGNLVISQNFKMLLKVYLYRQTEVYSAAACGNVFYLRQVRNLLFLIRQVVVGAYQDYKVRSIKDNKNFEPFSNDTIRNIVKKFLKKYAAVDLVIFMLFKIFSIL